MILYYLLLALCLSQFYPTSFYWPTAYTYGTLFIFYWLPAYPNGSLLPSTGQLPIPTVPYHLLMTLCLSLLFSFNHLLTHCLYLWYYSTFYWLPVYPCGTVLPSTGSLSIPMVLYYLLLAPCYTFGTLLSSTVQLLLPMVFCYLLLAHCLSRIFTIPIVPYFFLIAPCLSLWLSFNHLLTHCLYLNYYSTFYCLPANPYGTILPSTGSLPIPMVLYYLLLAPCLYRWYATIFYCPTANTYGTLLSSTGLLPIPHFISF